MMRFSFLMLSFVLCALFNLTAAENKEIGDLLGDTVDALGRGLQYMEDHVTEINLDGAFGCRLVEELLHAFLRSSPVAFDLQRSRVVLELEMLASKAGRIADVAKHYIKISEPYYYGVVGGLLEKSDVTMWYPSRDTKPSLRVEPLPCSKSAFNETVSDGCMKELQSIRTDRSDSCIPSKECLNFMTRSRKRGYMLTHQVLYLELMEMKNCLKKSGLKVIPRSLQDTLCSNVMRDAEEIALSGYPVSHRDLFMEQIGLCGLWGYKDFWKKEWLREILQWQQKSGCYSNVASYHCTENLTELKIRDKRDEKILQDGCSSHKTTVALVALAASIRFNIEKIYQIV